MKSALLLEATPFRANLFALINSLNAKLQSRKDVNEKLLHRGQCFLFTSTIVSAVVSLTVTIATMSSVSCKTV